MTAIERVIGGGRRGLQSVLKHLLKRGIASALTTGRTLGLTLVLLGLTAAHAEIGDIEAMRGVGSLQKAGRPAQILGKGLTVDQGDIITTSANSFAIVHLSDGTRMTVRPESRVVIQDYDFKPAAADNESAGSMVFNLLKGGLRTITGLIPKHDSNAARVLTPSATVGIRGTDFDVRLCQGDCGREQLADEKGNGKGAKEVERQNLIPASARIVQLQGTAVAVGDAGSGNKRRLLAVGAPAYPGDTIETGAASFVVLVFRDESKMTVQPNSNFQIEDFVYDDKNPNEGRVLVNLLKGGLRAFTGLIGKINHQNVTLHTPSATVGIRGTGLDMSVAENGDTSATVWDGSIELTPAPGQCRGSCAPLQLGIGESGAFVKNGSGNMVKYAQPPAVPAQSGPRPDTVPADMQKLFGVASMKGGQDGLYVLVRDGHVSIVTESQTLDLGRGEAGYTDGTTLLRPLSIPLFLDADKIPLPTGGTLGQGLAALIKANGIKSQCLR